MQIIDNALAIKCFQISIFLNMLINLHNELNATFEINKLIKFFNGFVTITKKDRFSSIKPLLTLLKEIILITLYIL